MSQHSSSTSSSDRALTPRRAAVLALWVLAGLALIDLLVNVAFAYPADPKVTSVGQVRSYFEYGRSTEGKLARITRPEPGRTAPITLAGWYRPLVATMPRGAAADGPVVTFYGMSHSVRLAEALARTSTRYRSRSVGAPGATANWAHGAFLRDGGKAQSRAVVLSIMSINAPMVTTMTAMTWNSAFPMPYTSDRYYLGPQGLRAVPLPFESFDGYVRAFYDPALWSRARSEFRRHDPYYNELLMRRTILDHSAIVRLMRRAYGLRLEREKRGGLLRDQAAGAASEEMRLLNAIVRSFAAKAREQRILPVIFVINNQGYSTSLYDAVRGSLEECRIPHLSSHTLVSPGDPRNYLPDTHFTDENDDRLARALEQAIDRSLEEEAISRPASPRCL